MSETAKFSLDRRLAQSLLEHIAADLNRDVVITDARGQIIAASKPAYIGKQRDSALYTDPSREGVFTGYWAPIDCGGQFAGMLAVAGNPDEAAPYAKLAVRYVEAALLASFRQEQLLRLFQEKKSVQSLLLSKLIAIQEKERRCLSRELHDEIGQMLTSIMIGLRVAAGEARENECSRLQEVRELTANTLEAVRRLALELRPMLLDDHGLEAAAKRYLQKYSSRYGIEVSGSFQAIAGERFDGGIEITLYRIMQEALTNIAKHANATRAVIEFGREAGSLTMVISDNGGGFDASSDAARSDCLGLYGMQERVSLLNGTLNINSEAGKGTTITVTIPVLG
ncbi:MAG: histidine kinase [Negativicutes bacterium]|nr:histidine kinase [Negativicutes bacterium]